MKPAFALSLDQDGITLLHRTSQGFAVVGEADPENADLGAHLAVLRSTALGLAPQGLTTKIVLPASQILYVDIEAPGPDRGTRRAQIARALEGRTPYPVGDLVYDWSGTGRIVQVAVVARVTLEEAEAFAEDYRFAPVCFVAVPPEGRFAGEPYFGQTSRAAEHLPDGERLDRDQDPLRMLGVGAGVVAAEVPAEVPAGEDTAEARPIGEAVQDAAEAEGPFRIVVGDDPDVSGEVGRPRLGDSEGPASAAEDTDAQDTAVGGRSDAAASATAESGGDDDPVALSAVGEDAPDNMPGAEEAPTADDAEAEQGVQGASVVAADLPDADAPVEDTPPPETVAQETVQPEARATPEAGEAGSADPDDTGPDAPPPADMAVDPAPDLAAAADADAADADVADTADADMADADAASEPATPPTAADQATPDTGDGAFATRRKRRGQAGAQAPSDSAATAAPADDAETTAATPAHGAETVTAADAANLSADAGEAAAPAKPTPPVSGVLAGIAAAAAKGAASITAPDLPEPSPGDSDRPSGNGTGGGLPDRPEPRAVRDVPPGPSSYAAAPIRQGIVPGERRGSDAGPAAPTEQRALLSRMLSRAAAPAPADPQRGAALFRKAAGRRSPNPRAAAASRLRPRYMGVALTVALLFVMAAVAIWSSLFETGPAGVTSDAGQIGSPDQSVTDAGSVAVPDAAETAPLADSSAPSAVAAPQSEPAAQPEAAANVTPAAPGAVLPVPDTLQGYAQDGLLAVAPSAAQLPEPDATGAPPPGPVDPDPVFGADIVLPGSDVLAADPPLGSQVAPVPFAEALRYGTDGLIVATPEGVEAPGGFTLIAGSPLRVPPVRPADLVPATAIPVPGTIPAVPLSEPNPLAGKRPLQRPVGIGPSDDALVTPDAPLPTGTAPAAPADPALAALKPRQRPGSVTLATAAAPATQPVAAAPSAAVAPALAPPADPSHAALKPRARSSTVIAGLVDRQAVADAVADAAAAALAAETNAAAVPGAATATRSAVASSRRPSSKPSQFAQSVEAALAAAATEPQPDAEAEAVAASVAVAAPQPQPEPEPAPAAEAQVAEEIDEPEPESAAPDIPTRASVAKQATIKNALDLGDVSLIGVYGSSSNRRALVRMSSGRFVKVEVGDRLDGGKVAAIGDGQLTYVKNGRSIVLKMIRDS